MNHSADVDSIEQKDTSGKNENKNDNNSNIKLDEKAKDAKKKKKCCWVYNYLIISEYLIIIFKKIYN